MKAFDIAPFALPNCAPGEIRFEEPRDIQEVIVEFTGKAPTDLTLSYMRKTWPETRWELSRDRADPFYFGWSRRDDQFNCSWQLARVRARRRGRTVTFNFRGLVSELGREARGYDVTFRRTLGLRLCGRRLPPISRITVHTVSAPASSRIRISFNAGRSTPGRTVRVAGYNALVRPTTVRCGARETVISIGHMTPLNRYSGDAGHVRFDLDNDACTISLEDIDHDGAVWYARAGIYVSRADNSETFEEYRHRTSSKRTVLNLVSHRPETSLAAAMYGQPRPHPDAYSLGCKHARQKFWLEPNGDLVLHRHNVTRVPGRDTEKYLCRGNARFFFGFETWVPAARFNDPAPVPAYNIHMKKGGILLEQKSVCVPLLADIAKGETVPDAPMVVLMRFRFRNTGDRPTEAGFTLRYSQDSNRSYNACNGAGHGQNDRLIPPSEHDSLSINGRDIVSRFSGKKVRRLRFSAGVRASVVRNGVCLSRRLNPGEKFDLLLKIPYVSLESPQELAALDRLDFTRSHRAMTSFWRTENARGSRIETPDEHLNSVYAAHLSHVLMTDSGMPDATDLVNTSVGTSTYGNFSNESCMIIQELDQRGFHDECRRRLDLWVKYQGTAPQPGNFTDYSGMYFGAGGFEDGAYNQHHGWVLWCMAEHYFLTRDRTWFGKVASSVIRGADWIFRQRRNTMRQLPHSRGWERGFLPAGSLEDVTDFNYWLSTNALTWRGADHAAAALVAIGHPDAARVRREADAYRRDLVRGFEEMRRAAPISRLNDGRWVPRYPSRLYARERDYGWIREVLEGAVYLLISGLYDSNGEEAGWILNDYQDNLYHTPPYGYPMIDLERNLPYRGGFSMQPNLLAGLLPHLDRDEIKAYQWMFFNAFASCYREEISAMIEHPSPELGFSNSAHFKTSDEANSVMWLRYMFVHWNRNELRLGRAIPASWLEPGNEIGITKVATYFGSVSVHYSSRPGRIRLVAELGLPANAGRIIARIPTPTGAPLRSVMVNGRRWTRADRKTGNVDITGLNGRIVIDTTY